jgi:hypothetical protein
MTSEPFSDATRPAFLRNVNLAKHQRIREITTQIPSCQQEVANDGNWAMLEACLN